MDPICTSLQLAAPYSMGLIECGVLFGVKSGSRNPGSNNRNSYFVYSWVFVYRRVQVSKVLRSDCITIQLDIDFHDSYGNGTSNGEEEKKSPRSEFSSAKNKALGTLEGEGQLLLTLSTPPTTLRAFSV